MKRILLQCLLMAVLVANHTVVTADQASDTQKMLNDQVLAKPFSVEDEAKLNSYIEEATKRGTPPKSQPSKYWRQGYTCNDLRRYSWNDYRDCSYYHHYYGYYWPY
ncbi:hypothetical protein ACH50O_06750 [Methylomonas sp. 2BW1-5-20]|uniref:hypothetical protein n=1 Tax=Methylomonas sp. 2BW1-5-20 TaxID=3376686 RepID=UPI0040507424